MATIGYPLTAPESGWKRHDTTYNNAIQKAGFTLNQGFSGDWNQTMEVGNASTDETAENTYAKFNFTGTKLRITSRLDKIFSSKVRIVIDGVESFFSQDSAERVNQGLCFEIMNIADAEHSVLIQATQGNKFVGLDAIDTDINGELKPYNPIESEPNIPVPINLVATAGDSQVTLSWDAVTGATGYNVKRSTTAGGPYTTIASNVSGTSYVDTDVVNGTTYYYVVTAITADGESANSNEASATPTAIGTPGENGQALLRVTMIDSSEREYKLPKTDIDNFVTWFTRTVGTGTSVYVLNKMTGSKEYLAFNKIISFEVTELK